MSYIGMEPRTRQIPLSQGEHDPAPAPRAPRRPYLESARLIGEYLRQHGPSMPADIRRGAGVSKSALYTFLQLGRRCGQVVYLPGRVYALKEAEASQ